MLLGGGKCLLCHMVGSCRVRRVVGGGGGGGGGGAEDSYILWSEYGLRAQCVDFRSSTSKQRTRWELICTNRTNCSSAETTVGQILVQGFCWFGLLSSCIQIKES